MKKVIFIALFVVVALFFFVKESPALASDDMCCPAGYSHSFWTCPMFTPADTCCRRTGFGDYELLPKVLCNGTPLTGNYCCPPGYGVGMFDCPFGANPDTQCCKRNGWFNYDVVSKISCTIGANTGLSTQSALELCVFDKNPGRCVSCASGGGLWTAIGCVPLGSASQLFGSLLNFGIGIAGIIAFILMLFGALQMMISSGNPEKLNAGKELVTSAITGLFLIIFSVFILGLIGYNILGIPGFK